MSRVGFKTRGRLEGFGVHKGFRVGFGVGFKTGFEVSYISSKIEDVQYEFTLHRILLCSFYLQSFDT